MALWLSRGNAELAREGEKSFTVEKSNVKRNSSRLNRMRITNSRTHGIKKRQGFISFIVFQIAWRVIFLLPCTMASPHSALRMPLPQRGAG